MENILNKIKTYKIEEVKERKLKLPISSLESKAANADKVRGFQNSLKLSSSNGFALIAEIKKASPSRGIIREDFNPSDLAIAYQKGGAACLSILTDNPSFQGHESFLINARKKIKLPVLRKDFMLDPYQIVESRSINADCILIIMAFVSDSLANELEATAFEYNMDVLIEVHDEFELERALKLRSTLIGINNRDLKTFKVSLSITKKLAKLIPSEYTLVSESGIFTNNDMIELSKYGARSFLIGESLMREEDVANATTHLLSSK
ncbi:MAG: indole-3-glycerol phosphate synthase TrpC [Rhodobacteraceae bacterium]|nr:indole-3-glycerol phosphate synthase TrpC [Paracoccaceae bacterium]